MDDLSSIIYEKDTTFMLMLGADRRGHDVYFLPKGGIIRKEGQTFFHTVKLTPQKNPQKPFCRHQPITLSENETDIIFIRPDPPFDEEYLINTWLLDLINKEIAIINHPAGIRSVNEKIWISQFKEITPPTFIGRNKNDILSFLEKHGEVIVKPINSYGGQSIFFITRADTNTSVILETMTSNWRKDIILQKYLPEAEKGDKRILLLNGEILGAVLRIHSPNDHRNNLFCGGKATKTVITDRDKKIVNILRPYLIKLGLYFVGIDIIGDYLIEVNVTSPTCLQEINKLYSVSLEDKIILFAEELIKKQKS